MQLFETMRLAEGKFSRLSYHKARIKQASAQLGFVYDENEWEQLIETLVNKYTTGVYRVKVLLNESGSLDYVVAELSVKNKFTAKLTPLTSDVNKKKLTHKTTDRKHLEHNHHTDLVLLHDRKGKLLEFDIGNLMIKEGGQFYTPIYNEDFLRGCMRQSLIDDGKLSQKDYTINEFKEKLQKHEIQVFLINSLREVADVEIYL